MRSLKTNEATKRLPQGSSLIGCVALTERRWHAVTTKVVFRKRLRDAGDRPDARSNSR